MHSLEITIQHPRDGHWPVVAEHRQPGNLTRRSEGKLVLDVDSKKQLISLGQNCRGYGSLLGKALFQDSIRDGFVDARAAAGHGSLRVLLVVEAPDLKPLHWGRLCAPGGHSGWDFLALNRRTPFSLYLPSLTDLRFPAIGRTDLRALVLLAEPPEVNDYGLAHFDAAATAAVVTGTLGTIPHDFLARVPQAVGPASLDALADHIAAGSPDGPYTLLHVVAHGRVTDRETVLFLLDSVGEVEPVPADALIERLHRLGGERGLPHLVFLAACEGGKPEAESARGGLAQRLVRELGIPAVVAMTDQVSIATATDLTGAFYARLRASGTPDLALVEAGAGLQGRHDALVPSLFSRLGDSPLFSDRLDEDRPLTPAEIDFGLKRLADLLPERAPVLIPAWKVLASTPGLTSDPLALSHEAQKGRTKALDALDAMAQEVLDLTLPALALDHPVPGWDGRCPFPGLNAFQPDDAGFFFGRETKVQHLEERLRSERFLAVLGNSGSGKSSLVLAGLAPRFLGEAFVDPGRLRRFTPGANPETALALQLGEPLPPDRDTLLVVDQLEELFTHCTDLTCRETFVQQLIAAWNDNPRLFVVLTLRADFWGDCADYTDLKNAMQVHQELIAAMDTAELRSAMEQQAATVGLRLEGDLSHGILAEVEGEPGAMPLLQHLLLELWKRRHGRWLLAWEYRALGGIKAAVAHTADGIYADYNQNKSIQGTLRNLFVRLTRLDEAGTVRDPHRDTRQRVLLNELVSQGIDAENVRALIQRLADARLVVTSTVPDTGKTEVEVSHDALIRHWPRLRAWLEEDRACWLLLAAVGRQARDWQANGEKDADLPRWGERLQQAMVLFGQRRLTPTETEQRFLARAKAVAEQDAREREELAEREREALERARHQLAISQWNEGKRERDLNHSLQAAIYFARASETYYASGKLAAATNAELARSRSYDTPLLQVMLGHRRVVGGAYSTDGSVRLASSNDYSLANQITRHRVPVGAIFSRDGTRVVTWSGDNNVYIWDSRSGEAITPPLRHDNWVEVAKFSDDETQILTWSADNTARLWNSHTGKPITPSLKHSKWICGAQLSINGTHVLTWSNDGSARVWDSRTGKPLTPPLKHEGAVKGAQFSPDSSHILTWSQDGSARLWDSRTGKPLTPPLKHEGAVEGAQFSPDGSRILTWSQDGSARLWDSRTGKPLTPPLKHEGAVEGAQFSPDSSRILTWSKDGTARLWDSRSGKPLTPPLKHEGAVKGAQFSPDSSHILTWSQDGSARLWDSRSGKPLTPPLKHGDCVLGAQFSPDSSRILTWSLDGSARVWDSRSGKPLTPPLKHEGAVVGAQFSQEESRILTWSKDSSARVWDSRSGKPLTPPLMHAGEVEGAQFSPDSSRILTWSEDGSGRLWYSRTGKPLTPPLKHGDWVLGAQFSQDESRILTWSRDGSARVWDSASGDPLTPPLKHGDWVRGAQFSHDESRILTWSRDGSARLWDSRTGKPLAPPLKHEGAVEGAQFSPDSSRILTWSKDGSARLWDSRTGKPLTPPLKHEGAVEGAQFSPDSSRILTWSKDGTARLWDSRSGKPLAPPLKHEGAVEGAQFSPDSSHILTWSQDGSARLWDSRSGKPLTPPLKHGGCVLGAQFSPDSSRILTWSLDGSARLWDSRSGELLTPPLNHELSLRGAQFCQDGSRILTWSRDGTARLWETCTGKPLTPPLNHEGDVYEAQFSPDSSRILTSGEDGTARLWDSCTGKAVTPPLKHSQVAVFAMFSSDGTRIVTWGDDGTVRLWDSQSGEVLTAPLEHDGAVFNVRFGASESHLLTYSEDGTIRLWDITIDTDWPANKRVLRTEVETGTLLTEFGELRVLSADEWRRKKWCEYDAIRHDLKRISDAEWAESQRRCKALDEPPAESQANPGTPPTTQRPNGGPLGPA